MNKNYILFGLLFPTACLYAAQPLELDQSATAMTREGARIIKTFYQDSTWDSLQSLPVTNGEQVTMRHYLDTIWDSLQSLPVANVGQPVSVENVKCLFTHLSLEAQGNRVADREAIGSIIGCIATLGTVDPARTSDNQEIEKQADTVVAYRKLYRKIATKVKPTSELVLSADKMKMYELQHGKNIHGGFFLLGLGGLAGCAWWWYKGSSQSLLNTLFKWSTCAVSGLWTISAFQVWQTDKKRYETLTTSIKERQDYFSNLADGMKQRIEAWK